MNRGQKKAKKNFPRWPVKSKSTSIIGWCASFSFSVLARFAGFAGCSFFAVLRGLRGLRGATYFSVCSTWNIAKRGAYGACGVCGALLSELRRATPRATARLSAKLSSRGPGRGAFDDGARPAWTRVEPWKLPVDNLWKTCEQPVDKSPRTPCILRTFESYSHFLHRLYPLIHNLSTG